MLYAVLHLLRLGKLLVFPGVGYFTKNSLGGGGERNGRCIVWDRFLLTSDPNSRFS